MSNVRTKELSPAQPFSTFNLLDSAMLSDFRMNTYDWLKTKCSDLKCGPDLLTPPPPNPRSVIAPFSKTVLIPLKEITRRCSLKSSII